jgi:carbamoyl-phosphate synthase large subunit
LEDENVMLHKVLVTGAGGGGGENLIGSLRRSSLDLIIYGSNMDEYLLAKSSADTKVWLPSAQEEHYTEFLEGLIRREGIELVIPNSDTEVGRISRDRDRLPCRVFLPPDDVVRICQDKLRLHEVLVRAGLPQAKCSGLSSLDDIDAFIAETPGDRFWVRPRRGAGSMGATWVKSAEQARNWIKLWVDLRGMKLTDYTISEFLPGRDYAFQSVWENGHLKVAKMVERLAYVMARNQLSNMSSSPSVARTLRDEQTLEDIFKAIHAVSAVPHGNYNLDLKGDVTGRMCVTEFNIGRFCMITPVFDLTGKYNTADIHVRCGLGETVDIKDPIDIEEGVFLIRELDTTPTIMREDELADRTRKAKQLVTVEEPVEKI